MEYNVGDILGYDRLSARSHPGRSNSAIHLTYSRETCRWCGVAHPVELRKVSQSQDSRLLSKCLLFLTGSNLVLVFVWLS